jgi:uncharacterized protein (DUF952 family)
VIFFVLYREEWENLETDLVAAPGDNGFVHCCEEGQLELVRQRYFPADAELVALAFDPVMLKAETRYEPGSGGEPERCPHVYGELRRECVVFVLEPQARTRPSGMAWTKRRE